MLARKTAPVSEFVGPDKKVETGRADASSALIRVPSFLVRNLLSC
jgi:hypothetical protein